MSEINVTKIENEADSSAVEINRKATDGTIVDLQKDGTTVGSIASDSASILLGSGDVGVYFDALSDRIIPMNMSTLSVRNDAIDIGGNPHRFKDLYLSGGVYLGGTGSANKLDDYEEGTWTPVYRTGSPTGTAITVTGGTQYSRYVKVGNLVQLNFGFANSTVSGSAGGLYISGFPFTLWSDGNTSHRTKGSSISYINGFNDSGDASLFVESSYALFLFQQATTWSLPTYTPTSGSYIHATVVIETST